MDGLATVSMSKNRRIRSALCYSHQQDNTMNNDDDDGNFSDGFIFFCAHTISAKLQSLNSKLKGVILCLRWQCCKYKNMLFMICWIKKTSQWNTCAKKSQLLFTIIYIIFVNEGLFNNNTIVISKEMSQIHMRLSDYIICVEKFLVPFSSTSFAFIFTFLYNYF